MARLHAQHPRIFSQYTSRILRPAFGAGILPDRGRARSSQDAGLSRKYPESAKARRLIRSQPVSSGFENSTYNSLNAFLFTNAKGVVVPARWSMVPV
jgi:hypothetical protein